MKQSNLIGYVDYIMSFFERLNCREGQGLFLLRTMRGVSQRDGTTQEDLQILYRIVHLLYCNEFLKINEDNESFYVLTEKGYQYIQGARELPLDSLLYLVVDYSGDYTKFFQELWWMIGKEDKAPFYVSGPMFYNTICHYITTEPSYSLFIQDRVNSKKQTSRVVWYNELLKVMPVEQRESFLRDLSKKIDEENNVDIYESKSQDNSINPFIKEDKLKQAVKKHIYVSYAYGDIAIDTWVQTLANDLKDEFDVHIGLQMPIDADMVEYTKESIEKCDKVLLLLTPRYKEFADKDILEMGNETMLITEEMYNSADRIKFIPIVREGTYKTSYPMYLGVRNGIDMTDNSKYEEQLEILKKNLLLN